MKSYINIFVKGNHLKSPVIKKIEISKPINVNGSKQLFDSLLENEIPGKRFWGLLQNSLMSCKPFLAPSITKAFVLYLPLT